MDYEIGEWQASNLVKLDILRMVIRLMPYRLSATKIRPLQRKCVD